MTQIVPTLLAFSAGLYFAACQVGYFIHMEFNLSSTFVSFYVVVGLWLLGGVAGLLLRSPGVGPLLVLGGLLCFYLHRAILMRFPYDMSMLPLYLLFVLCTALYSGYFFRHARRDFSAVKALFFHENNGFLLGYLAAVAQLLLFGLQSVQAFPAVTAVLHLLLLLVARRPKRGFEKAS